MGETIVRILAAVLRFRVDESSQRDASDAINNFARGAMRQLKAIGEVAAVIAFDKIVQNLLKATSQAEDTAFKFDNIYGDLSDSQEKWAESFADTYNRSATKVKESLASIQHEMLGFTKAGTDAEKRNVSELSKTIEQAALNLGAFYGLDSKTAINTLLSATQGSEAAMQQFNVGQGTTLTRRRQEAMNQLRDEGSLSRQVRSYENLTPYEKALVNLRTVLNANTQATDALTRSQGNYSTMQANLKESLEELKETLGEFFLPTAKKIVDFLIQVVRYLNDFVGVIKSVTDWIGITDEAVEGLSVVIAILVGMKVLNWAQGVVSGFSAIWTAAVKAAGGVSGATATISGGLVASIGILAVAIGLVSDLSKFLRGEESKTGTIIEKLGIDAEKAKPYIEVLRALIVGLTVAFTALRVATLLFGNAILATPIGWIIAGIALLITLITIAVKHWDKIKEAATKAIEAVKNALTSLRDWFVGIFQKIKDGFDKLPGWAKDLAALFLGPLGPILILINHLDQLKEAAKAAFEWVGKAKDTVVNWGKEKIAGIKDAWNNLAGLDVYGYEATAKSLGAASYSTVSMAGGTYNSGNRNITQNFTFNQEFKGPESMEQKTTRAAQDSAEDVMDVMAIQLAAMN